MQKRIIGVMACDPEGLVGNSKTNKLPWSYPEDTFFWQNLVKGMPLIMGYNTFCNLPEKLLLENCIAVISTKQQPKEFNFFCSIEAFLQSELYKKTPVFYHIGGALTMNEFLCNKLINEFYLTKIKSSYQGDLFLALDLIECYPHEKIFENQDFSILHYIRHLNTRCLNE